ncbi:hypothetical protein SmJEL517_g00013 [Synchytrium microbalum]|uniref:Uncharacterized protein n=1 Tax=Synchytrium microbalum TaxID=1806994 RepID=A0A507CF26_9FUNG|nr:uncharacterized protein SmJEL517_g00013 [Synchytrium microbalum]TPX38232.1 hypothetical protein SmJEL517_g00013 [Synchytrium microbalum]
MAAAASVSASPSVRTYATQSQPMPELNIGGPRLPPHLIAATLAKPKLSQQGNPIDIKRQFLYALYTSILPKRIVFVIQLNALSASEYQTLTREFRKRGMNILKIRLGVFRAAAKKFGQRGTMSWVPSIVDPHPESMYTISHKNGVRLSEMPVGHTAIVFADNIPESVSKVLQSVNQVVDKVKPKVFVVGAKIDCDVYSKAELDYVATLPSIKELREQLVGVLMGPGGKLVQTLQNVQETQGVMLVKTLEARPAELVDVLGRREDGEASSQQQ